MGIDTLQLESDARAAGNTGIRVPESAMKIEDIKLSPDQKTYGGSDAKTDKLYKNHLELRREWLQKYNLKNPDPQLGTDKLKSIIESALQRGDSDSTRWLAEIQDHSRVAVDIQVANKLLRTLVEITYPEFDIERTVAAVINQITTKKLSKCRVWMETSWKS